MTTPLSNRTMPRAYLLRVCLVFLTFGLATRSMAQDHTVQEGQLTSDTIRFSEASGRSRVGWPVRQSGRTGRASYGIAAELESHRWRRRVLVMYTPNPQAAVVNEQLESLRVNASQVRDRDLVIYIISGHGDVSRYEPRVARETAGTLFQTRLGRVSPGALEKRFQLEPSQAQGFLIGKDGEIKARYPLPWDLQSTWDLIDAMPMRQRELGGQRSAR